MERKKSFGVAFFIVIFVISTSFLTGVSIWAQFDKPNYYKFLPLLPFSFGIISILFINLYKKIVKNLAVCLVISLYYIRNVLTPLIMSLGNYYGIITIQSEESVIYAVILLIVETLIVFCTLDYKSKYDTKIKRTLMGNVKIEKSKNFIFEITMILSAFIMLYTYLSVPEVSSMFTNIFSDNAAIFNVTPNEDIIPRGSFNRILYTLFSIFFSFYRIFIPTWFMYLIRKKMSRNRSIAIILSVLLIMLQLMFIGSQTMYTFIVMVVLLFVLIKLYPKNKIFILMLVGIGMIFGLIVIILGKSQEGIVDFESMSAFLQAYFPGISNMAGVFNINNESKLSTFFYDLYTLIPFRATLFGLQGETLTDLYRNSNNAGGQIIPNIGQGYHYIGVLAPFSSMFVVSLANRYERLRKVENNIWKFTTYTFIVIYAAATPILYNLSILGNFYITAMLPMLLLSYYSGNKFDFECLENK